MTHTEIESLLAELAELEASLAYDHLDDEYDDEAQLAEAYKRQYLLRCLQLN